MSLFLANVISTEVLARSSIYMDQDYLIKDRRVLMGSLIFEGPSRNYK